MRRVHVAGIIVLSGLSLGFAQTATDVRDAAWVADRVVRWQPTERERMWEKIGWAKDLREALSLARRHNRPVFLYTHDGRLSVGRC